MGKNIISQARGKGGPTYRAPSFRYKGAAKHNSLRNEIIEAKIIDLVHCQGHSAPLAKAKWSTGEEGLMIAAEGLKVGDVVTSGSKEVKPGNIVELDNIPEGTAINNIEANPGDGGKFCRSSGVNARVFSKIGRFVVIELPSKKQKKLLGKCRACVGVVAGGGRLEKPLLRAGTKFHAMKAKNKLWPRTSGASMNAVDHPFGNKRSSRKSKARPIPKNAPPGRKVGMVGARRTGRRKK